MNVVFEDPLSKEEVPRLAGCLDGVGCSPVARGILVTDEIDILCDGTVSAASASGFS